MSPADMLDPNFMPILHSLAQALTASAPEDATSWRCVVEQAPAHAQGRLQYVIGSPDNPAETMTQPTPELHAAAFQLFRHWSKEGGGFPRTQISIQRQPDGNWKTNVSRLDDSDAQHNVPVSDEQHEERWQAVYRAREVFLTSRFGAPPDEIQKLMNLTGVWPGGGIFPIEASQLGGMGMCTSCGLTNYDMPPPVRLEKQERAENKSAPGLMSKFRQLLGLTAHDAGASQSSSTLTMQLGPRVPRWIPADLAGYGYELLIVTPKPERWPVLALSWFIQMEILNDVDLLNRVRENDGVTVESVKIGDGTQSVDFLVNLADDPLPSSVDLPNGKMHQLVATRITRDEMNFSQEEGRPALRDRLRQAGVGQTSVLDRPGVI